MNLRTSLPTESEIKDDLIYRMLYPDNIAWNIVVTGTAIFPRQTRFEAEETVRFFSNNGIEFKVYNYKPFIDELVDVTLSFEPKKKAKSKSFIQSLISFFKW